MPKLANDTHEQEREELVSRLRHLQHEDGKVVAEIILTADRGQLQVAVGEPAPTPENTIMLYGDDIPHPTAITIDVAGVDTLIRMLPKLRAWMVSGEPAFPA